MGIGDLRRRFCWRCKRPGTHTVRGRPVCVACPDKMHLADYELVTPYVPFPAIDRARATRGFTE